MNKQCNTLAQLNTLKLVRRFAGFTTLLFTWATVSPCFSMSHKYFSGFILKVKQEVNRAYLTERLSCCSLFAVSFRYLSVTARNNDVLIDWWLKRVLENKRAKGRHDAPKTHNTATMSFPLSLRHISCLPLYCIPTNKGKNAPLKEILLKKNKHVEWRGNSMSCYRGSDTVVAV